MTALLPAAVFRWSTPLVVPGPHPYPMAPLYRVADFAPKRADCPWHPSGGMVCAHCDDIGLVTP